VETSVRFAEPADLAVVLSQNYIPAERMARLIEQRQVVVAEQAGMPVGYACLDFLVVTTPFLGIIRVFDDYRRRGVGQAILRFLEEHLRALGHETLYSSSQADEPEPQAWHRRVGFEECGFIDGLNRGGVGEVFFRKRLR
jgi:L-amino acid N-acyltransferase YncA